MPRISFWGLDRVKPETPVKPRRRATRFRVERMESRALMAVGGVPAAFTSLIGSLQAQVTAGPLLGLADGTIQSGSTFINDLTALVGSFESQVAQQYARVSPRLVNLVDLQASALESTERQWNQQLIVGLFNGSPPYAPAVVPYNYLKNASTTVIQLTMSRPLWPMGTPNLSLYQRADTLAHTLELDVVDNIGAGANLTPANAEALGLAESSAFAADYNATLTARPFINQYAQSAVATLNANLAAIGAPGVDARQEAQFAQQGFVTQMLTGVGLFGDQGPLRGVFRAPTVPANYPYSQYAKLYTFKNAQATAVVLPETTTFFRVFSDTPPPPFGNGSNLPENNFFGAFTSTQDFFSSATAINKLALDQSYYHPSKATMKVNVTVPVTPTTSLANKTVYVGIVAPIYQGVYSPRLVPNLYNGGANQTIILTRNTVYSDPRSVTANP